MDARTINALKALETLGVEVLPKGPPDEKDGWFCAKDSGFLDRRNMKAHFNRGVKEGVLESQRFHCGHNKVTYYRAIHAKKTTRKGKA